MEPQEGLRCRGRPELLAILSVFFLSGSAALVLEISWSRQVGVLLGQTIHASTMVLVAFFAGMAIGHWIGTTSRLSHRPLLAYGGCEFLTALWVLAVPQLLKFAESPDILGGLSSDSLIVQTAFRSAFCFLVLLPAATALGATLPLIASFIKAGTEPNGPFSRRIATAYGLNTLGAVLGVCVATVLISDVGVVRISYFAAGIAGACGVVAVSLHCIDRTESPIRAVHPPVATAVSHWKRPDSYLVIAAVSGFTSLALEVLYLRLFALVFHNSTYSFATVTCVFIGSLAIGSFAAAILVRRYRTDDLIAVTFGLASIATIISPWAFARMTGFTYFGFGETLTAYQFGSVCLVAATVAPVVVTAGIVLPALWSAPKRDHSSHVGQTAAVNTAAGACGAVFAAFVLLPQLGLWRSFGVIAFLYLSCAVWVFARRRKWRMAAISTCATIAIVIVAIPYLEHAGRSTSALQGKLLKRWNSAYGWIDVVEVKPGTLEIRENLHYRHGASGANVIREHRQAHIPLLIHRRPRSVLFLGLGTGLTAGPAVKYPNVEKVDVVELIPEVVRAARFFDRYNFGVVDHAKTTIHRDDATHFLTRSHSKYDVIVSDLFVPWESRTGYLYTVEHYRLVRRHLTTNGLFCQWLPVYQLGAGDFELIADSFSSVFPTTTIWWGRLSSSRPIVALIGSENELTVNVHDLRRRLEVARKRANLSDSHLADERSFRNLFLGRWPRPKNRRLNTNEYPRLEFRTPISLGNRNLLTGAEFRTYFDAVWMKLPSDGVDWTGLPSVTREELRKARAMQRFMLFGSE